jgi:hypothetical protein
MFGLSPLILYKALKRQKSSSPNHTYTFIQFGLHKAPTSVTDKLQCRSAEDEAPIVFAGYMWVCLSAPNSLCKGQGYTSCACLACFIGIIHVRTYFCFKFIYILFYLLILFPNHGHSLFKLNCQLQL